MLTIQDLYEMGEDLVKNYSQMDLEEWKAKSEALAETVWMAYDEANHPLSEELFTLIARSVVFWNTYRKERVMKKLWWLSKTADLATQEKASSIILVVANSIGGDEKIKELLTLEEVDLNKSYSPSFVSIIRKIQN